MQWIRKKRLIDGAKVSDHGLQYLLELRARSFSMHTYTWSYKSKNMITGRITGSAISSKQYLFPKMKST